MDNHPKFPCPSCACTTFNGAAQPKSYSDLVGFTCATCGHTVSKEDLDGFFLRLALERGKEIFSSLRR